MITRPMLAAKTPNPIELQGLRFPVLATPKLDGIRCLKVGGVAVSRTFKRIPNEWTAKRIEATLPDGVDGELMLPCRLYNPIQSAFMSRSGTPLEMEYWIFDYVYSALETPYWNRIGSYHDGDHPSWVRTVMPKMCNSLEELLTFEQHCISDGFEGIVFRTPDSPYKCGRSTLKQQWMVKLKRFEDAEGLIIGCSEMMHNRNDPTHDQFGLTERSSHQENLEPAGMLGTLLLDTKDFGVIEVGTGFTMEQRRVFWQQQSQLTGRYATYKYFKVGMKEKPRHPVFKAIREDI